MPKQKKDLPAEEQAQLVTVCTVTNQTEADFVESILRAEGIDLIHDHEYATMAGIADTAGIHIAVRSEDAERARELLDKSDFARPEHEDKEG